MLFADWPANVHTSSGILKAIISWHSRFELPFHGGNGGSNPPGTPFGQGTVPDRWDTPYTGPLCEDSCRVDAYFALRELEAT